MPPFKAKRVTRTYMQKILAPPEVVFPLFCPVREADWLDGWDYELIYSESGYAEEGCVFKSRHPGEPETLWLITKHDKENYQIEFARITPGLKLGKVSIQLKDNWDGTTRAGITYTFTALSQAGNAFIDSFTEERFIESMIWWEKSMNYYLKNATRLTKDIESGEIR